MKNYRLLYTSALLAAVVLAGSGCGPQASAADFNGAETKESQAETTVADTTVVETVTGVIESMTETEAEAPDALRIYGPITKEEDGTLSIDNQSGVSSSGEIILTVSNETSRILDAVSGMPVNVDDMEDGTMAYVYIGEAMTMSLPPVTNAELIFVHIPEDFKVPDYVEVASMITDGSSSKSVLTSTDGTEYSLTEDCEIFPYLTRNFVTLDDLTKGRRCVVWSDGENNAEKIMLFAQ